MKKEQQTALGLNREEFLNSNWKEFIFLSDRLGYSSLFQEFNKAEKTAEDARHESTMAMFRLLSRACSMMFNVKSINEPFKPRLQDYQEGKRSAIPDDFTIDELAFFESILGDVDEPWLKGRLADLLWLCRKPKNPSHAREAIVAYISHPINSDTWRQYVDDCWERAARLCLQIKEYDVLKDIENQLLAAFREDGHESQFMVLWLAELLDRVGLAKDYHGEVSQRLYLIAEKLKSKDEFSNARSYFELAIKKFSQDGDEQGKLDGLIKIAECYEAEGDVRLTSATPSQMAANTFYENAIQAYRAIPVKHRDTYDVTTKIRLLRDKLTESGQASLGEMGLVRSPSVDMKDTVEASQAHVAGKESVEHALMYFTGLYDGPKYEELKEFAIEIINKNPLSSIFGSTHMASDGRVVAKTPPMSLSQEETPENEAVLHSQIHQQLSIEIQFVVEGNILPALRQILMEHRVKRELLEGLCYHSPLVPPNREKLTAMALWLGFEYEFANAIYLLCPQFEHMVRVKLKDAGAHTSNVDPSGIENENGLSALLDLPETIEVFGQNTVFEMKAIFTDSLGHNLRNEVAHGLLDDRSASSVGSIYAWWMILRLIVRSVIGLGNAEGDVE